MKNTWDTLTEEERDDLSYQLIMGNVTPDEEKEIDLFEVTLSTGKVVKGSYSWDYDNPTEWNMEVIKG